MVLYAVTVFLSAFLLFQVQPLIGRYALPWFGGSPAVWTTCLLFFQALLFAGYLYAHALSRLPRAGQRRLHTALLLLAAAGLALFAVLFGTPVAPPPLLRPEGSGTPALRIVGLLSATVGLPYFLLAATGPLLQAWAARLPGPERVWRLYALSNFGSLLALLAYPFLVEPALALRTQSWLWSLLFLLFAAAASVAAARQVPAASSDPPPGAPGALQPPGAVDRLLWLALPAAGTILLMATTNQMCQEVAVVPFLWVLPLSLYLLSFVLTFEAPRFPWRPVASVLFLLSLVPVGWVLGDATKVRVPFQILFYGLALLTGCLVCHGELYRLRPAPARLTGFYLGVAGGGAIGGLLVGVAAPLAFDSYREYPIGLLFAFALLIFVLARDRATPLGRILLVQATAVVLWLAAAAGLASRVASSEGQAIATFRNFYGVLRVREELPGDPVWHLRGLTHGRIQHGFQYFAPGKRRQPTTYYGEKSGIGRAIRGHPRRAAGEDLRIGAVGLGVGTLAAYVRKGDTIRFYEINPDVVALSRGPAPRFTFLADAPGTVEVVEGDARLSLERERRHGERQRFDVLALDAFTSDAIPVHLLTAEAFETYLDHLRDGSSLLAVHISNRNLRLQPVLAGILRRHGLAALELDTDPEGHAYSRSVWVVMARTKEALSRAGLAEGSQELEDGGMRVPLWTDDYSNVFRALVW
jgi:hypothetical protein